MTTRHGGDHSLALAESNANRWPEITAWAYVVGSVGERVVWTSGFDGLGRLIARELTRPLRLDEPPTCDFSFDEASVLADSKLADPLVHLRIKQSRVAAVALYPGVNMAIPLVPAPQDIGKPARGLGTSSGSSFPGNPLAVLSDALWPFLRGRVADLVRSERRSEDATQDSDELQRNRGRKKPSPYPQLPLSNPKR
jgi:hypothetical protein